MPSCTIAQQRELEEASWRTADQRHFYATPYTPGYPWSTAVEPAGTAVVARRHVIPYDYTFKVFVKGRWVGRSLLDVYAAELQHHSPAYYRACLQQGRLFCIRRATLQRHNVQRRLLKRSTAAVEPDAEERHSVAAGREIDPAATNSTPLAQGDVVCHVVHRHEIPVFVGVSGIDAVQLVAVCIQRYGLLCINKPTGLPTHATGRYYFNSIITMLEYVLAPRRLHGWLWDEDPLLQSLVSTQQLSFAEKVELWEYYAVDEGEATDTQPEAQKDVADLVVDPQKTPRPCHRLDKVTSGVLLLAVSQEAAKCVGEALMQKSNEIDAAATLAMKDMACGSSQPSTGHETEGDQAVSSLVENVLSVNCGLRKVYVARVHGIVDGSASSDSPVNGVSSNVWPVRSAWPLIQQKNRDIATFYTACEKAFSGLRGREHRRTGTETERPLWPWPQSDELCGGFGTFPDGLLVTAPIRGPGQGRKGGAESDSAPLLSAATLCQQVVTCRRLVSSNLLEGDARMSDGKSGSNQLDCIAGVEPASVFRNTNGTDSIFLCTPFTGRLHQIRCHLSHLGHPIVGDIAYADGVPSASSPSGPPASDPAVSFAVDPSLDYIYFDAEQLPVAYRAYILREEGQLKAPQTTPAQPSVASGSREGFAERRSEGGPPVLPHGDSQQRSGSLQSTPSPQSSCGDVMTEDAGEEEAVAAEPLCYECAGRLPIAGAKDCATGTSAVCLHAWMYQIAEQMLQPISARMSRAVRKTAPRNELAMRNADVDFRSVGGCVIVDGIVCFSVPLPSWAYC